MKVNWIFAALGVLLAGAAALLPFCVEGTWLWVLEGAVGLALLGVVLIYRMLAMPVAALRVGVDLLREQDFASRVRKVGQRDADNIAETFNAMMTALKNERLRVREQDHLLNLLIEASPTGIVIYDFDGKVCRMNSAAEEMLRGPLAAAVERIPAGRTETVRLNDTHIYRCSRLSFLDHGFQRPFMIIESLTEEVMKAERAAYEKVIRTIVHEVNNTMAGVVPLFDTVEAVSDDADLREAVGAGAERCANMSRFITRYADVVKVPEPELRPCRLEEIAGRSLPFLESLGAGQGITVSAEMPAAPAEVSADPVLLEQVLVNLVKNSVEAFRGAADSPGQAGDTGSDGNRPRIVIRVSGGPEPQIEIEDNGPGISQAEASALFTPFYTTKPGGQGLGLMLVSQILRRHGCRFSLATDPATSLTRFTIRFPQSR